MATHDKRIQPDVGTGISRGGVSPDVQNGPGFGADISYQLDDKHARQLGEWLTTDVARVAGWEQYIPKEKLRSIHTGQLTSLAKLVFDACVQYHQTGTFPSDVVYHGQRAMSQTNQSNQMNQNQQENATP